MIDDPHSVQEYQQNERDNYYRDTNFLISDVIQKQHSDPELKALLNYIESETLPESQFFPEFQSLKIKNGYL